MRVMLIMWADPRPYISTIFTAKRLSDEGFLVELFYRNSDLSRQINEEIDCGINTKVHMTNSKNYGWRDKIYYLYFIIKLIISCQNIKPDVVIGYAKLGLIASFILKKIYPNIRLIYHNFDFDKSDYQANNKSSFSNFLSKLELKMARNADITIFPSEKRGVVFKELANLLQDPITLKNCYPLNFTIQKNGELKELLRSKNLNFDKLVVRTGMIGPYHAIEETIRSIVDWKGNFGFILAGFCNDSEYLNKLHQIVKELKLRDRVLILPAVSNALFYDCLFSADLGIVFYEQYKSGLSHQNMAGTSQKLNGFFVAGTPCLVSNHGDFINFVEKYKTCKVVDVSNPNSIAQSVNSLLPFTSEYETYKDNICLLIHI